MLLLDYLICTKYAGAKKKREKTMELCMFYFAIVVLNSGPPL